MTPQEMKAKMLELSKPLDEFMREHKVASFSLDNAPEGGKATFEVRCFQVPLPPDIRCSLSVYGSIYLVDEPLSVLLDKRREETE